MDVAKGIGILAVIAGHVGVGDLKYLLYVFNVPIFFVISGYFFRCNKDVAAFAIKKAKAYLLPYVFCAIILSLFCYLRAGFDVAILKEELLAFAIQKRHMTLWFLTTLFLAVVIYNLICVITKNKIAMKLAVSIVLGIVTVLCVSPMEGYLPWNIDAALPALIYIAFGDYLKEKNIIEHVVNESEHKIRIAVIVGTGGLLLAGLNFCICGSIYDMFGNQYGIFPLTMTAAMMCSFAIIVASSAIESKALAYIGRNSILFFALHQSMAMPIANSIWSLLDLGASTIIKVAQKIFTFVFVLAFCGAIDWLVRKTALRTFIGK